MNKRSLFVLGALGLALLGVFLAWRAALATRDVRATAEAIRQGRSRLQQETRQRMAAAPAGQKIPARGNPADEARRAATQAREKERQEDLQEWLDPRTQALNVQIFRERLALDYYAFYRTAGWNAERIAKFEALLTEHEGRVEDIKTTVRADGLPNSDPAIVRLRREEEERHARALNELLDEDSRRQVAQFGAEADVRRLSGEMQFALFFTPTPLEPEQTRQLEEALRAAGFAKRDPARAMMETTLARRTTAGSTIGDRAMWDAFLAQARGFLTPAQWSTVEARARRAVPEAAASAELGDFIRQVQKQDALKGK